MATPVASERKSWSLTKRGDRSQRAPGFLKLPTSSRFLVRIPAKSNSIPEGSRTAFRAEAEHHSERSDAGFLIEREVFGLVKETPDPERSGGRRPHAGKGVRGKGQRSRSPLGTGETRRALAAGPIYAPPPRFLRIESPFISMRWALWTT